MAMVEQESSALFLGDHVVMDLLNSLALKEGELYDFWQGDAEVLAWLQRVGLLADGALETKIRAGSLVDAARRLREAVRALVVARKSGRGVDVTALNAVLAEGSSKLELRKERGAGLAVRRVYEVRNAAQVLTPLAEVAAEFLATADFELVRHCEGEGCVLWFYDRTKSHRRRWCSMEVCGNRHKVAAFRARMGER